MSSITNTKVFQAISAMRDQSLDPNRQTTPKKQVTRHDFLFSTSKPQANTTFSGLKIRDKNETKFQSGFQIPSEVLKSNKKIFADK